jgi:hypothetical protein
MILLKTVKNLRKSVQEVKIISLFLPQTQVRKTVCPRRNLTLIWMTSLKEVLLTKRPEMIQEEGVMTSLERSATMGPSPSPLHNAKIDFKLKQYSGETNLCALWFWELEKSLKKLRINEGDYILHAINASSDKAQTTFCLLDDELQSNYDQIKKNYDCHF